MNKSVPCPDSSFLRTSGMSGLLLGFFLQHFFVRAQISEVKCWWFGCSGREPSESRRITCSSLCKSNGCLPVNIWVCAKLSYWIMSEGGGTSPL